METLPERSRIVPESHCYNILIHFKQPPDRQSLKEKQQQQQMVMFGWAVRG